jgi:hypothetical protein
MIFSETSSTFRIVREERRSEDDARAVKGRRVQVS